MNSYIHSQTNISRQKHMKWKKLIPNMATVPSSDYMNAPCYSKLDFFIS